MHHAGGGAGSLPAGQLGGRVPTQGGRASSASAGILGPARGMSGASPPARARLHMRGDACLHHGRTSMIPPNYPIRITGPDSLQTACPWWTCQHKGVRLRMRLRAFQTLPRAHRPWCLAVALMAMHQPKRLMPCRHGEAVSMPARPQPPWACLCRPCGCHGLIPCLRGADGRGAGAGDAVDGMPDGGGCVCVQEHHGQEGSPASPGEPVRGGAWAQGEGAGDASCGLLDASAGASWPAPALAVAPLSPLPRPSARDAVHGSLGGDTRSDGLPARGMPQTACCGCRDDAAHGRGLPDASRGGSPCGALPSPAPWTGHGRHAATAASCPVLRGRCTYAVRSRWCQNSVRAPQGWPWCQKQPAPSPRRGWAAA